MNKNEAKNLEIGTVVSDKKTGEFFVVKGVQELKDCFKVDVENNDKKLPFVHKDLKIEDGVKTSDVLEEKTKDIKEKKENGNRAKIYNKMTHEVKTEQVFTQEEYDKIGMNPKRNMPDGVVVYPSDEKGLYISKKVGSDQVVYIKAFKLYYAKKLRNTLEL